MVVTKAMSVVALAALVSTAQAGLVGDAIVITATNARGTASYMVSQSSLQPVSTAAGPGLTYSSFTPGREVTDDSGRVIFRVNSVNVTYINDPQINFGFNVTAVGMDTTFIVSSATLFFAPIVGATGGATAGMTATDDSLDGAVSWVGQVGPVAGPAKSYLAQYNGPVPIGTDFARLVGNGAGAGSAVQFEDFAWPTANFVPILPPVTNMSVRFGFRLTADDSAGVTSSYAIVPAPGAAALLGLGGLLVARRRR